MCVIELSVEEGTLGNVDVMDASVNQVSQSDCVFSVSGYLIRSELQRCKSVTTLPLFDVLKDEVSWLELVLRGLCVWSCSCLDDVVTML